MIEPAPQCLALTGSAMLMIFVCILVAYVVLYGLMASAGLNRPKKED